MKNRIATVVAAVITAIMLAFGTVAPATAAPVKSAVASQNAAAVPMGNGTNNFYLSGYCSTPYSWNGVKLSATNWDYGSNQKYHLATSRSGVAWQIEGVYIAGKYIGKGILDTIVTRSGHSAYRLEIRGRVLGDSKIHTCSFPL